MNDEGSAFDVVGEMVLVGATIAMAVCTTGLLLLWLLFPGIGQYAVNHDGSSFRGEAFYGLLALAGGLWLMVRMQLQR